MQTISDLLTKPSKSILTLHRKPDGDSIGSNLALYHTLIKLGHTVSIYSKDPIPESFSFLSKSQEIQVVTPSKIPWDTYETYWALDMSSPAMLGEHVELPPTLTIINIDHHDSNQQWGAVNRVDPQEVSVASLLYQLFQEENIEIDIDSATCLLTGLLTDSGFFSYIHDAKPLAIAAGLIQKGVAYQDLIFQLQRQKDIRDVQFLGKALEQIKIFKEKRFVIIPVSYEVWTKYGVSLDKNYLLTSYIHEVKETDAGVVIIEETRGNYRLEFRSRVKDYDVSRIAKALGGGGHVPAAGAHITAGSMQEAIDAVLLASG
jgi:phosphoesterase RecJ-like protein